MIQTVVFENRIITIGVLLHYATLFERIKVSAPSRSVELSDDSNVKPDNQKELTKRKHEPCNNFVTSTRIFCSLSCSSKHRVMTGNGYKKKRVLEDKHCKNPECNKLFRPQQDKTVFCSSSCAKAVLKRDKKQCAYCKKIFSPKKASSICCSRSCSAKHSSNNRLNKIGNATSGK